MPTGKRFSRSGRIRVSVDVTNTGDRAGKEVVQLYIGDRESALPRPVKELKGFSKVSLEPGETRTVSFEITPEALQYYDDAKGLWTAEEGIFDARSALPRTTSAEAWNLP